MVIGIIWERLNNKNVKVIRLFDGDECRQKKVFSARLASKKNETKKGREDRILGEGIRQ